MSRTGEGKEISRRGRNKALEAFSRHYTLAVEMAVAVIVPLLIGRWLDARTGKAPWFTLGGVVLGGAAAIRSAHRVITEFLRELKKNDESSKENSSE